MPEMQLLRPDHAPALLAFELENRAYFAASIPDRGDDYFTRFDERHRALLAEQETGACFFHVLVGAGGEVLGRVNLVDVADGGADLGYRIAERAAGRGLATRAVRELCGVAARGYGLSVLRAATTLTNAASQAVLAHSGFAVVGETRLSGHPGLTYLRSLRDLHDPHEPHDPHKPHKPHEPHDLGDTPDATARSGPAS
ncbi:GNAT family N-acetyltransferase [Streptomyces fagopyri]|uniref:GNAT family N-acetyltransferase n=1 Tax=Streptomyces fagopyri TaxID=2662397 RepID=UPI0038113FF7